MAPSRGPNDAHSSWRRKALIPCISPDQPGADHQHCDCLTCGCLSAGVRQCLSLAFEGSPPFFTRELFCGNTGALPASLGPLVIPGREAQGNEDYSADDFQKEHDFTWFIECAGAPTSIHPSHFSSSVELGRSS